MTIKVKFAKFFVSGMLKDISVDCVLPMANMDSANDYMRFCHAHATKPAKSLESNSAFVIFNARIVAE